MKPLKKKRPAIKRKASISDEIDQFARLAAREKVDLGGKHDFDDEYDEELRKKYKQMGIEI